MACEERWSAIHELVGWKVCPDLEAAIEKAHIKRHPRHDAYIAVSVSIPLTDSEKNIYSELNENLHDEIRETTHEHFLNIPVPKEIQENHGDDWFFTPFARQNYDWYGPTYECPIVVLTDYISCALLYRFQLLLHGIYQDWCIRVDGSDGLNFDTDHEIAVFSDEVLVSVTAARAMHFPE